MAIDFKKPKEFSPKLHHVFLDTSIFLVDKGSQKTVFDLYLDKKIEDLKSRFPNIYDKILSKYEDGENRIRETYIYYIQYRKTLQKIGEYLIKYTNNNINTDKYDFIEPFSLKFLGVQHDKFSRIGKKERYLYSENIDKIELTWRFDLFRFNKFIAKNENVSKIINVTEKKDVINFVLNEVIIKDMDYPKYYNGFKKLIEMNGINKVEEAIIFSDTINEETDSSIIFAIANKN